MDDNAVKTLFAKISKGDKEALAELFVAFGSRIKNTAFRVLRDWALSEDILNDVIIKVWNKADKIAELNSATGYIMTTTYNLSLDVLRKQRRSLSIDYIEAAKAPDGAGEDYVIVSDIMNSLPEEERTLLLLIENFGYSIEECSKVLKINYFKARRSYLKAKKEFAKKFEQ